MMCVARVMRRANWLATAAAQQACVATQRRVVVKDLWLWRAQRTVFQQQLVVNRILLLFCVALHLQVTRLCRRPLPHPRLPSLPRVFQRAPVRPLRVLLARVSACRLVSCWSTAINAFQERLLILHRFLALRFHPLPFHPHPFHRLLFLPHRCRDLARPFARPRAPDRVRSASPPINVVAPLKTLSWSAQTAKQSPHHPLLFLLKRAWTPAAIRRLFVALFLARLLVPHHSIVNLLSCPVQRH